MSDAVNRAESAGEIAQRQIAEARSRRGMSQRQLAAALGALGFEISHPSIARTENGKRSVTLDEALAFAAALDTSPVHLFLPLTEPVDVAVTPDLVVNRHVARDWIIGRQPLPGQQRRIFYGDRSEEELAAMRLPELPLITRAVAELVRATNAEDDERVAEVVSDLTEQLQRIHKGRKESGA